MLTEEFNEKFRESAIKHHGVLMHMLKDLKMSKQELIRLKENNYIL